MPESKAVKKAYRQGKAEGYTVGCGVANRRLCDAYLVIAQASMLIPQEDSQQPYAQIIRQFIQDRVGK